MEQKLLLSKSLPIDFTNDASITLQTSSEDGSYALVDGNCTPAVTAVKIGDKTLTQGKDYEVSYRNNTVAGATGTVVITGKGNYTGELTQQFKIVSEPTENPKTSIAEATITLASTSYRCLSLTNITNSSLINYL